MGIGWVVVGRGGVVNGRDACKRKVFARLRRLSHVGWTPINVALQRGAAFCVPPKLVFEREFLPPPVKCHSWRNTKLSLRNWRLQLLSGLRAGSDPSFPHSLAALRSQREEVRRTGHPAAQTCSGLRCCGPGVTVCGAQATSTCHSESGKRVEKRRGATWVGVQVSGSISDGVRVRSSPPYRMAATPTGTFPGLGWGGCQPVGARSGHNTGTRLRPQPLPAAYLLQVDAALR
jgi:hypothetical protein